MQNDTALTAYDPSLLRQFFYWIALTGSLYKKLIIQTKNLYFRRKGYIIKKRMFVRFLHNHRKEFSPCLLMSI